MVLPTLKSAWIADDTIACQWYDDNPLAPTVPRLLPRQVVSLIHGQAYVKLSPVFCNVHKLEADECAIHVLTVMNFTL